MSLYLCNKTFTDKYSGIGAIWSKFFYGANLLFVYTFLAILSILIRICHIFEEAMVGFPPSPSICTYVCLRQIQNNTLSSTRKYDISIDDKPPVFIKINKLSYLKFRRKKKIQTHFAPVHRGGGSRAFLRGGGRMGIFMGDV